MHPVVVATDAMIRYCISLVPLIWTAAKIVTGSLGGTLRVFLPAPGGFKIQHLLLEESMGKPILHLAIGRFAPSTTLQALAVLHPRELVVCVIKASESSTATGAAASSYTLTRLYSHKLGEALGASFTAASMCYGEFRATRGRDLICVQSMDGQLSIFDHESHVCTRQLPAALLPGPITYVSQIDAFVTVDCTLYARAYRYGAVLGASDALPSGAKRGAATGAAAGVAGRSREGEATATPASSSSSGGRQLRPMWSVNLGEPVDGLAACRLSAGLSEQEADILAVGRRTVFCVKERGVGSSTASTKSGSAPVARTSSVTTVSANEPFRLQRRLEYPVACCCVFSGDGKSVAPDGSAGPVESSGAIAADGGATRAGDAASSPAPHGRQRLLVASRNGQLQVFAGVRLVWAAKLAGGKDAVPMAVSVGRFGGLAGLVAQLLPDGGVAVTYMGTDPPQTSADGIGARGKDVDAAASEEEHRRLLGVIREAQGSASTASSRSRVLSRLFVEPSVEACEAPQPEPGLPGLTAETATDAAKASSLVRGTLFVTFVGEPGQEAKQVRATILAPPCVKLSVSSWDVGTLGSGGAADGDGGDSPAGAASGAGGSADSGAGREVTRAGSSRPVELSFTVTGRAEGMPSTLTMRAVVTYVTSNGAARVSQTALRLPLATICRAVPPVKVGAFRLTLDTAERKHTLAQLFADVLSQPTAAAGAESQAGDGAAGGGQGITLRMHCGADVTLLASGKSNRLRVQAGSFEALQLVAAELTARLQAGGPPQDDHASASVGSAAAAGGARGSGSASARGTRVSYVDPLPLADLKRFIQEHWDARRDLAASLASLNDGAYQLRLVQKRLLTRFRDRTPADIGGLDKLLSATYDQVMAAAEAVEMAQAELAAAGGRLRCAVRLFLLLLCLAHGLSSADAEALEAALPPEPQDSLEQGWEERTDASLMHLLRAMTGKSKALGGAGVAEAPGLPDSAEPLLRHVDILVERLAAGVKPAAALRPPGPTFVRPAA